MSDIMINETYRPGVGFLAGIIEFFRGQSARDCTFLQTIGYKHAPMPLATRLEMAITRGKIEVAKEVGFGGEPNRGDGINYRREVYDFPLFKEYNVLTGKQLNIRPPYADAFFGSSKADIENYWMQEMLKSMYNKMLATREAMVSDLLLTGRLRYDKTPTMDLKRDTGLDITLTTKWTDAQGNFDALADLAKLASAIASKGSVRPKDVIMNTNTFAMMQRSKKFIEAAQYTYSGIRVEKSELDDRGADFVGTINAVGKMLNIWLYDKKYVNAAGQEVNFVPDNKVLMGDFTPGNRHLNWYFGATDLLTSYEAMAQQYGLPKTEAQSLIKYGEVVPGIMYNGLGVQVHLQSSMVCIPDDINNFGVMTVA